MAIRQIKRLLIANRGEIARRIIRACRELDIETVAVYSDADAGAPHVSEADHAVRIGAAPARDSYLNIDAIIGAAQSHRPTRCIPATASCPNVHRSRARAKTAGLIFVGPPASALEKMGSKTGARALMTGARVPVVPGETPGDQSDDALRPRPRASASRS